MAHICTICILPLQHGVFSLKVLGNSQFNWQMCIVLSENICNITILVDYYNIF